MDHTEDAPLPQPRRLSDHISEALLGLAQRQLDAHPDRPAWFLDALAVWIETAAERIEIEAVVDRRPSGRVDTRSLRLDVSLPMLDNATSVLLCSVRVRDLIDEHGDPINARDDARTLLLQNGYGVPDSPAALGKAG